MIDRRVWKVYKRRGLKINLDLSKMTMVRNETPPCEIMLVRKQLEQVSELKYLGYRLDE